MINNDYFDLIADFADGSLDASQEDNLFMVLSSNEELRTQFKNHLAVKSAIRSGFGLASVPAFSKSQIFNKLGMTLPSEAIPANPAFWGRFGNFVLNNRRSIATGLVSILATAFVMYQLVNINHSDKNIQVTGKSHNFNNIARIESSSKDIQVTAPIINNKINGPSHKSAGSSQVLSENMPVTVDHDGTIEENINTTKLVSNSSLTKNENKLNLRLDNNFAEYSPVLNLNLNSNFTNNFSVELRNSSNWFDSKPVIGPKNSMALNNFGISVLYNPNHNLSFGLDFRLENFSINYHGFEGAQEYNYYQQPNFSTISGLLRYKMDNLNNFKPFVQISGGINSLGFVGRGLLGTEYSIANNLSLVLSGEYNMLFFNYQNNGFRSPKYSLNYGFLYNF